ncbi:APC family permease [Actinophytocola sp.]|uniref:APC family permease n=1 Tax=Actinophytocola sp. TaxID=1872138 RepID=UPI003D6BA1C6
MPGTGGEAAIAAGPESSSAPGSGTASGSDSLFPGASRLPVRASWWVAVLVATGASLMVVVSLREMAVELGNVSILVWVVTAAVGGLQCLLIAELASRFPRRAGGTAQFAYRATPQGSRSLGALSSWCYWFAWTPGIAINLILAATYLSDTFWPSVDPIVLAGLIGAVLYVITAMGLKLTTVIYTVLATVAALVILILISAPVFQPETFDSSAIVPMEIPEGGPQGGSDVFAAILKWGFIATWAAYAAEMASTICAEITRPERYMKRVMSMSAIITFIAFSAVPIALFGLVGVEGVQNEPFSVFANAGGVVLGPTGELIVGLGLAAVLIIGAETFIIGSSRTIYQMARDRHLPKIFGKVNKRGTPVGSIAWDALVIGVMLAVFGTDVVQLVAAATVGYTLVFIMMPIAYLRLRRHRGGRHGSFRLGKPFAVVAALLTLYNAVLLVFGGPQWGLTVMVVGFGVSFLIVPISFLTNRFQRADIDIPEQGASPQLPVSQSGSGR